ncbi:MAG: Bax inhibitor-1/YccA family protein [Deltaproteobacteria bacterium]|jgi:FtsH-binding integral membrane protein|nr:Bax inhibitor-1/YccA family protein [Deltaproteobacteria bacterium]
MIDLTRPNRNQGMTAQLAAASEATFFQKVYMWMCGGLALTAVVSYALANSQAWLSILASSRLAWLFIFAVQIGLVIAINALINKVSAQVIKGLFLLYSASVGMTVSVVLMVYPTDVIAKAFFSTCLIYGAMAAYGLMTKKSLEAWGGFLFMGLIGLIVASLINLIFASPFVHYVICWIAVIVFAGLTAYDHQKLRVIHAGGFANTDMEDKIIIHGSLTLYLDFINLFLALTRILGAARD